jgi:hypothetical protein
MELNTDEETPRGAVESEARIYVLADSGGAVGAFLTRAEAAAVKKRYPSVPMLIYAFPLRRSAPADKIYVIPYRQTNAVAYASNSRAECEEVQKTLLTIGLAYEDSLDYWECAAGQLIESGEKRLHELHELERLALDSNAYAEMRRDSDEKTEQLFALHDAAVSAALASVGNGSLPVVGTGLGAAAPTEEVWGAEGPPPGDPSQVSILEFVVPNRLECEPE